MRKVLLGLFIITSNTFGQIHPIDELTKDKKILNREYRKEYYSNDNIKLEGWYLRYRYSDKWDVGCDSGIIKRYFRNGKLKEVWYNSAPCFRDSIIQYWKNGNQKNIRTLKPPLFYGEEGGEIIIFAKTYYEKCYRKDGSIEMEGPDIQSATYISLILKEGIWKFYNTTGQISKLVTYSNGKKIKVEKMN